MRGRQPAAIGVSRLTAAPCDTMGVWLVRKWMQRRNCPPPAAGRPRAAEQLAQALEAFAGASGLLPEQIWDGADIPERELFFGRASGSAMPLVWAHAEYLKLCRSLRDGEIFDRPPQTVKRYLGKKAATSQRVVWRFNNKVRTMPARRTLRIETQAKALVHWSADGWQTVRDAATHDTTLGVHVVDLPTTRLSDGDRLDFTFYWPEVDRWEETDFWVRINASSISASSAARPRTARAAARSARATSTRQ